MSWGKVDDQFHSHRKAKRAWNAHPRALGLHLLAMSYCAGQLTNGLVDDEFVAEKMPRERERTAATSALVDAGLWDREQDGWRIHDWLDFNPSREEVLEKRRRDSERKARGRTSQSKRSPRGIQAESDGPVPTRPIPKEPLTPKGGKSDPVLEVVEDDDPGASLPQRVTGNRKRDREAFEAAVVAYAAARFPDLPEPERAGYTRSAIGQLRNPTHESVEEYVRRWLTPERPAAKEAAA